MRSAVRWNQTALHRQLSMPWWGVTDGQRGVMTPSRRRGTVCSPLNGSQPTTGPGRCRRSLGWTSKHAWGYSRRVTFHFLEEGGHVAMAKAFRRYEQQRGAFRSWEAKVADNPDVAQLKGALDV